MRPVHRGNAPQVFDDYKDAKPFLVDRLGGYCSYCERPIKTLLAVEHILPKSLHPELQDEWTNFLLACVNCNSTKADKPVQRENILLPDQDNTLLAFAYDEHGRVFAAPTLDDDLREKAESIMKLTGLDRFPDEFDTDELFIAALERWQQRSQAWQLAEKRLAALEESNSPVVRELILELAVATGFFSVWLAVFSEDLQMRQGRRVAWHRNGLL